ncbi:hypothetical protein COO91_02983 [Nostoc flagelliforme CCNUN1]|uniref:Uncharacterized protein n=1 Tax=Nostoc flagelliforme CCNUN1 TaxID=2038116 RepID=A0A2K8SNQ4_9NOSO|nr:hypothetical protein COO91_02983 [Nostoc flagelliforme CCNUN1]
MTGVQGAGEKILPYLPLLLLLPHVPVSSIANLNANHK